jgi:hypothetical protein
MMGGSRGGRGEDCEAGLKSYILRSLWFLFCSIFFSVCVVFRFLEDEKKRNKSPHKHTPSMGDTSRRNSADTGS